MYPATRSISPRHAAPAPSPRRSSRSPRSHSPGRGRKKTPPRRNHCAFPAIEIKLLPRDMVAQNGRAPADLRLDHLAADSCARITLLAGVTGVLTASSCMLVTPVEVPAVEVDPCLRYQRNLEFVSITLEVSVRTRDKCPYKHEKPPAEPAAPVQAEGSARRTDSRPQLLQIFRRGGPLP